MQFPLHEATERISFLIGTWVGHGTGKYPTIDGFEYDESIVFDHVGKPFLSYVQRTKGAVGPLHSEAGFLRPVGLSGLELTIAQPTGIVEVHAGEQSGTTLSLKSHVVGRSKTAVDVQTVERIIEVAGDRLTYELHMAAVGQPHQIHLAAELLRQS